ncbi:Zinc finger protein CONSTANS-like [Sarracenia purpurea var. burkii]
MRLRANEGKGNPARQVFDVLTDPRSVVLQVRSRKASVASPWAAHLVHLQRISLCQTCDSLEHTGWASASTHQEVVNCYFGCPSATELSTIRPFVLDFPSVGEFTCEQEMNSMNITKRIPTNCGDPVQGNNGQDAFVSVEVNDVQDSGNSSVLMGSSSMLQMNMVPKNVDQPVELANSTSSKVCCPGTKVPDFCKDDFYEEFNMDEVDLNVENYEELFGVALNDSEQLFGNDRIVSLFGVKGLFGAADPNYQVTHAAECAMQSFKIY